ncbi:MAG: gluconate 2-dehydrogenase subunit 3 family protein [Acidimicrobiales bacterium]
MKTSRRRFLQVALAGGAVAVIPTPVLEWARAAASPSDITIATGTAAGTGAVTGYFLTDQRWATCAALCSRVVPTGSDPTTDPGATEAKAVVFIDRYLAAFELPASLADNPAIWLTGPFSGRNPEPDSANGQPSSTYPADSMLGSDGQAHFLALSRIQHLAWKATLYGPEVLATEAGNAAGPWVAQVQAGTIPGPPPGGQRQLYAAGLDAFDSWSQSTFGTHYASATPQEQDILLEAAGNHVLSGLSAVPLPTPPAPPPAAEALFSTLLSHTFQACYGLPEYRWEHSNPLWPVIGYDGDTQPLGNSIYDENLAGAGKDEGSNAGFGMAGVYQPVGGYVEYRPVSYLDPSESSPMTTAEEAKWVPVIQKMIKRGDS